MPTGYTAIIEDNEDCTFEDYFWRCVRGMGACILMRDDPLDVLPSAESIVENNSWQKKQLETAQQELYDFEHMSDSAMQRQIDSEYADMVGRLEKSNAEALNISNRYAAIRAKAAAWVPPTKEHEGLKRFMLDQIDSCTKYSDIMKILAKETLAEWKLRKVKSLNHDIVYHKTKLAEEIERNSNRIAFLQALEKSVARPEPRKSKK